MARLRWAGKLDMYRKIPADLMEGTRRGSALSYLAAVVMAVLFLMETKAFFQKRCVLIFRFFFLFLWFLFKYFFVSFAEIQQLTMLHCTLISTLQYGYGPGVG